MKKNLPNFLIVGAAKSGTSSLHNYLNQHPDIFMPSFNQNGMKVKEPRFLVKDLVKHRVHNGVWSWDEYQALFDGSDKFKAIGESTVLYLYYYEHAINNIKSRLGDEVKIIIMLRNPIDRAYSAYQHVSRGVHESFSFEDALDKEKDRLDKNPRLTPMVMYKGMGMYYNMVKAYLESFNHVHIIYYEDFRKETEKVLQKTLDFLELDYNHDIDFITKHNVGGKRWKNNFFKNIFMNDSFLTETLKTFIPFNIRKEIRKNLVNITTNRVEDMNLKTRESLIDIFRQDIENLSNLIKKDLTHWLK